MSAHILKSHIHRAKKKKKKEIKLGSRKIKTALSGLSNSCWGLPWELLSCVHERKAALGHSTLSFPPFCVDRDSLHRRCYWTPGWVWRRISWRWKRKHSCPNSNGSFLRARARKRHGLQCKYVHKQAFFNCTEKSCLRPASTVAHAAFQDLLSCGQRPRSQPPGTLTYTRRPAARHSQRIRPMATRALPPRHRQPQIESGGGARWLAGANPVGQWCPACIVRPPMGRLGEATQGSGSRWSYV